MEGKRINEVLGPDFLKAISGCTGAPCLPLKNGTAHWK